MTLSTMARQRPGASTHAPAVPAHRSAGLGPVGNGHKPTMAPSSDSSRKQAAVRVLSALYNEPKTRWRTRVRDVPASVGAPPSLREWEEQRVPRATAVTGRSGDSSDGCHHLRSPGGPAARSALSLLREEGLHAFKQSPGPAGTVLGTPLRVRGLGKCRRHSRRETEGPP